VGRVFLVSNDETAQNFGAIRPTNVFLQNLPTVTSVKPLSAGNIS
jgi:hypothetical protein